MLPCLRSLLGFQAILLVLLLTCDIPGKFFQHALWKALADNLGHILISVTLWLACTRPLNKLRFRIENPTDSVLMWLCATISRFRNAATPLWVAELGLSMASASLLDADHFIESRSFTLFGATHLSERPRGHSVFFIILLLVSSAQS